MDSRIRRSVIPHEAARETGLARYFTGQACKNGHIAERRTIDKRCVECLSEKWSRRYAIHSDHYKATASRHYDLKKEEIKERSRLWYRDNKDKARERWLKYYENNKAAVIEAIARWNKQNPEKRRSHHVNERARQRGAEGYVTGEDILILFRRQGGECFCGTSLVERFTVDHIIPLASGGTNWPDNIQLLCALCNRDKGSKTDDDWKRERGFL